MSNPSAPRNGTTHSGHSRSSARFLLNGCAHYPSRSAQALHLYGVFLVPPPKETVLFPDISTFTSTSKAGLTSNRCKPINSVRFYQALNRLSRSSYVHKLKTKTPIRNRPPLFDLDGHRIPDLWFRQPRVLAGSLFGDSIADVADIMPSSCQDIRAALAQCLQESDCIMIQRNKPSDCLRPPLIDTMPTKCQQLKKGYGECKRGMVDMRKRFRGNQPIAVSKEIEGGGATQKQGRMLYAGKPAFADTAKETDGNEPEQKDWRELENEKFREGKS